MTVCSHPSKMLQLPPELWLQVAHHVPDKELYKLHAISNTFFQAALDRTYREVRLIDRCPSGFIHKLACLENPLAGPRVKSLYICPSAVAGALIATQGGLEGFKGVIKSIPPSWFATSAKTKPEDIFPRQLISTLSKLTSIEELTFEWGFLPRGYDRTILSSIYPLLARNLLSLKLSMSFSVMLDVLSDMVVVGLDNLRELSLEFTHASDGTDGLMLPADDSETLSQLAMQVSKLSNLRSLAVTSAGHLDFSPFFGSLERFPLLSRLVLQLPLDPPHLQDATGFNLLLHRHASVKRLVLSPQQCCRLSRDLGDPSTDWLLDCFNNVSFPHLGTFKIGLNILGSSEPRTAHTLSFIGKAVQSIEHLDIEGRIISYDDLKLILEALRQERVIPPRSLCIEVLVLEPRLIDMLSVMLPELEFLDVTYRWISPSDCSGKTSFADEMEGKMYVGWKLRRLMLRAAAACERDKDGPACKASIVRCVPGLCG